MKKFTLMLTGSVLLLSGCTGMKSEFDCTETAQNGCLTMDEANNRARMKTETEKQNIRLPPLAEVRPATVTAPALRVSSARAPVATASVTGGTPANVRPVQAGVTGPRNPFRGNAAPARAGVTPPAGMTVAGTRALSAWSDTGMQPPVRLPSGTARLWIAAWIDEDQVYHQPSVVSFEVTPARWATQEGA